MSEEINHFELSVVIPAYNESERILPTLDKTYEYFNSRKINFEVIVIDDGSSDNTMDILKKFQSDHLNFSILEFKENIGKGAAVRSGMLKACGKFILYQDADGATPIEEIDRLLNEIQEADIVIASRAINSNETKVITHIHRRVLGRIFNFVANIFAVPNIADTQCGFKLFKNDAAKEIFKLQVLNGFSFDVEVLYLAKKLGFKIKEIAVNWHDVPGTKVNVLYDGLKMFYEIILIKFLHKDKSF